MEKANGAYRSPVLHSSPEWQNTVASIAALEAQQRILHDENQRRLQLMEHGLSEALEKLTVISTNTAVLPQIMERIDNLESSRDRLKGAMAVLCAMGTALGAFGDWLFHRLGGK